MEQLTTQRAPGRVLISGGASGLGRAVALAVRDAGGTPIVLDIAGAPGGDTAGAPGPDIAGAPGRGTDGLDTEIADVADTRGAEAAVRRAALRHGGLDAVFTAAGIDYPAPFGSLPGESWERIVAVNLLGTAAVVRAALPFLRESPLGSVITVASTLGLRAVPDATAYCAAKWGVVGFTRSLAAELRGQVRVTLLVPGGMDTAFFDDRADKYKPPPGAKLNSPADVARAVLFALAQPPGCELRELVVASSHEESWP